MSRDDGITYICYKCGEKLKHRNMITIKNNDYVRNFDDFFKGTEAHCRDIPMHLCEKCTKKLYKMLKKNNFMW